MSIEELESIVSGLPAAELARFTQWFEKFMELPDDIRALADRILHSSKRIRAT